jgi:hypothetical protein
MKTDEVHDKLMEQSEQIDLIAKELRWILEECQRQNVQPGTPMGAEMLQKFFSLYKDYKQVRENTFELERQVKEVVFDDYIMGRIYHATADLLVRKVTQGIFEQFTSVAENGCLPDGDFSS